MSRSMLAILIDTCRAQAEATLMMERLRQEGSDEVTMARARRELVKGAEAALTTVALAEQMLAAVASSLSVIPQLVPVERGGQGDPPDDPPPRAA